ncbi:hypothetical protein RZS08_41850, partial [Arthrospira platensis SPKY1]|nr:hypothetical protein [Arthrospira platensis SPKY1]
FEAAKAKADELIHEFGTQAYREAMKQSAKAELREAQAFWQYVADTIESLTKPIEAPKPRSLAEMLAAKKAAAMQQSLQAQSHTNVGSASLDHKADSAQAFADEIQ